MQLSLKVSSVISVLMYHHQVKSINSNDEYCSIWQSSFDKIIHTIISRFGEGAWKGMLWFIIKTCNINHIN